MNTVTEAPNNATSAESDDTEDEGPAIAYDKGGRAHLVINDFEWGDGSLHYGPFLGDINIMNELIQGSDIAPIESPNEYMQMVHAF